LIQHRLRLRQINPAIGDGQRAADSLVYLEVESPLSGVIDAGLTAEQQRMKTPQQRPGLRPDHDALARRLCPAQHDARFAEAVARRFDVEHIKGLKLN